MTTFTREPPEGVLAGENVPIENDRENREQARIEQVAHQLRERPEYAHLALDARKRIARQLIRQTRGDK